MIEIHHRPKHYQAGIDDQYELMQTDVPAAGARPSRWRLIRRLHDVIDKDGNANSVEVYQGFHTSAVSVRESGAYSKFAPTELRLISAAEVGFMR